MLLFTDKQKIIQIIQDQQILNPNSIFFLIVLSSAFFRQKYGF